MKEYPKYSQFRRIGKNLNFLMLFGGSARVFVQNALENNWSHSEVLEFIKIENLFDLREEIAERSYRDSEKMIDYMTVAQHMINAFFDNYKGLKERIERNRKYVMEHGYLRSVYGATRLMPELYLQGEYDRKENNGKLHNLNNIAANADIQNFESCVVNRSMVLAEKALKENGIDAILFNNIHDSADFYVKKDQLEAFAKIINKIFTKEYPEYKHIPLPIDFTVVDLDQGHTYKHGFNYEVK